MINNVEQVILMLVAAYLLGSIPSGVWIGKAFFHIDIRRHGSGNIGTTNTYRVLGPIAGTVEWHIIGDERSKDIMVSKAELKRLIPENTPDINIWQKYGLLFLIAVGVIYSLVV